MGCRQCIALCTLGSGVRWNRSEECDKSDGQCTAREQRVNDEGHEKSTNRPMMVHRQTDLVGSDGSGCQTEVYTSRTATIGTVNLRVRNGGGSDRDTDSDDDNGGVSTG